MDSNNTGKITSSEIGALWTAYQQNSLSLIMLEYFKKNIEDSDVIPVVQNTYQMVQQQLDQITSIFRAENMPVPAGFDDSDLNPSAPQLYADTFYLFYINMMAKIGIGQYSVLSSLAVRDDIVLMMHTCLANTMQLHEDTTRILLNKGLLVRSPLIPKPERVEFIHDKSYMSGRSMFNDKRPLNSIEIGHLSYNIQTNLLGVMLTTSFSQTAKEQKIKNYMWRAKEISQKHLKIFTNTLIESNIQSPMSWDTEVLNVKDSVFSEKLMMFHISFLSAVGVGNYATAASSSMRSDLSMNYTRLSAEVAQLAQDGFDIMIQHGWLEEPPQSADRKDLADQN